MTMTLFASHTCRTGMPAMIDCSTRTPVAQSLIVVIISPHRTPHASLRPRASGRQVALSKPVPYLGVVESRRIDGVVGA